MIERVCEEGAIEDSARPAIGVPLYLSGDLGGVMILALPTAERPRMGTAPGDADGGSVTGVHRV